MPSVENSKKIKKNFEVCLEPCPVERAMRILGGKWKASILWHLKDEPVRFNQLSRQLGGASKKVLTEKLQELEKDGLVKRTVVSTKPIAVEYSVTKYGCTPIKVLQEVLNWAEENNI